MHKTYNQLTTGQKQIARNLHPIDFNQWLYQTSGVEILYCCK